MKLTKIISAAAMILGFTSCNFDFKNSCDDKWVIDNYSINSVQIKFDDSETKETADPATKKDSKITPSVKTVAHKADAKITIDDSYHVDTETTYSYSESPAIRKLIIKDQQAYVFEIINDSSTDPISVDFTLNVKTYPNDLNGTATDKEDEKKYTFSIAKATPQTITIYKNSPTFTFYASGTTNKTEYTSTTDTAGKTYITLK